MRNIIVALVISLVALIASIGLIFYFSCESTTNKVIEIATLSVQGIITGLVTFWGIYCTIHNQRLEQIKQERPKIQIEAQSGTGTGQIAKRVFSNYCFGKKDQIVRAIDCKFVDIGKRGINQVKIKMDKRLIDLRLDEIVTIYLINKGTHKIYLEYYDSYGQCYAQTITYTHKDNDEKYKFIYEY